MRAGSFAFFEGTKFALAYIDLCNWAFFGLLVLEDAN